VRIPSRNVGFSAAGILMTWTITTIAADSAICFIPPLTSNPFRALNMNIQKKNQKGKEKKIVFFIHFFSENVKPRTLTHEEKPLSAHQA
jgi:hypothetical protein